MATGGKILGVDHVGGNALITDRRGGSTLLTTLFMVLVLVGVGVGQKKGDSKREGVVVWSCEMEEVRAPRTALPDSSGKCPVLMGGVEMVPVKGEGGVVRECVRAAVKEGARPVMVNVCRAGLQPREQPSAKK